MANNSFVPSSEEVVTAKLAKLEIDFGKNIEQEVRMTGRICS